MLIIQRDSREYYHIRFIYYIFHSHRTHCGNRPNNKYIFVYERINFKQFRCLLHIENNPVEFIARFSGKGGTNETKTQHDFDKYYSKWLHRRSQQKKWNMNVTKNNRVCLQPSHIKHQKSINSKMYLWLWTVEVRINTKLAANKLYVWIDFLNVMKWHTCKYLLFEFSFDPKRIMRVNSSTQWSEIIFWYLVALIWSTFANIVTSKSLSQLWSAKYLDRFAIYCLISGAHCWPIVSLLESPKCLWFDFNDS